MHSQDLQKNVKIIPLDKIPTHNLPEDCRIDMELLRMDICEKYFSIFDSFTIKTVFRDIKHINGLWKRLYLVTANWRKIMINSTCMHYATFLY